MCGATSSALNMVRGSRSPGMIGRGCSRSDRSLISGGRRGVLPQNISRDIPTASIACSLMSRLRCGAFCGFGLADFWCYSKKIITGSRDKTIRIWDISTGECIRVLGQGSRFSSPPLIANTDIAAPHMSSPDYHRASVLCLQFDDEILVSGSSDYTCIVWSVHTYTPLMRLAHHTAGVLDVCFDKKYIVSCSKDTSVCIWDRKTGKLFRQLTGHRGPVNAVAIRGNLIVSASGDALIKLWNVDTGKCIRDFTGHNRGLACVQFSEDARTIVSGGNDQDIRIWDAASGECIRTLVGHQSLVRTLHLDSRNRRIISGSYDQVYYHLPAMLANIRVRC